MTHSKSITALVLLLGFSIPGVAMRGGFSGGGGNVIATNEVQNPLNLTVVSEVIAQSRSALPRYLITKESAFRHGRLNASDVAALGPLFRRSESIVSIVRHVNVTIETKDACYDQNHNPYDGSTFGTKPHTICMSALSVSRKVGAEMMSIETTALLLHEYAEVIGLNDQQAIAAQTAIYEDLLEGSHQPADVR